MPRFLAKLRSFFWSWGFLEFLLALVVLFVLAYVEEDWRGAHNWAVTKAAWEAKGETFDYNKFIPPQIPENQNLAALPLFKLENVQDGNGRSQLMDVTLRHAMRDDLSNLEIPPTGNWTEGELPDMAKIKKTMADNYGLAFKNTQPPDDALAQFNAIYPFFADFLSASKTRPLCRINADYTTQPPMLRRFGPLVDLIKLSRLLALHALLALDGNQPDLAVTDLRLNHELLLGAGQHPTLIGGLVALGLRTIGNTVIYDGLARHAWNDSQLAEIEQPLRPIDFLANFQFSVRAEAAETVENVMFFKRLGAKVSPDMLFGTTFAEARYFHWPGGWWDNNARLFSDFHFEQASEVDPQKHVVFPKLADKLNDQLNKSLDAWDAYAPWKVWFSEAAGSSGYVLMKKFAEGQVSVDETRIACALERYRLAHNAYPDSLDALAPAYLDAVPHDPMSGQAYRYHLRADGTFLLYSVGWNQVDDGGTLAFDKTNPKSIDYDHGDWVWPTPKPEH